MQVEQAEHLSVQCLLRQVGGSRYARLEACGGRKGGSWRLQGGLLNPVAPRTRYGRNGWRQRRCATRSGIFGWAWMRWSAATKALQREGEARRHLAPSERLLCKPTRWSQLVSKPTRKPSLPRRRVGHALRVFFVLAARCSGHRRLCMAGVAATLCLSRLCAFFGVLGVEKVNLLDRWCAHASTARFLAGIAKDVAGPISMHAGSHSLVRWAS